MPIANENNRCEQCCAYFNQTLPKCGSCKEVRYCSVQCQRINWTEGGHKEVCNSKKDSNYIMALIKKVDELTARIDELEGRVNVDTYDYIQATSTPIPITYPLEENSGYENHNCNACELMMNGYTGGQHSCMRSEN